MQRRAALGVAAAVTAALLGASTALAAGTGLFGGIDDPGAGQLAPVLTADPVPAAGAAEPVVDEASTVVEAPRSVEIPAGPAPAPASAPTAAEGEDESSGQGRGRGRGRGGDDTATAEASSGSVDSTGDSSGQGRGRGRGGDGSDDDD